ncbi:substrate-binding periplasmic protein [Undibacterium baiyunense]|uniref:Transporter substrate-binding domain-containing protein n=1 Tax=Undibacterium baiyunense TaxID=2828731 RepID=A0A941DE00_9BURK|nr:transporter substrate-binding domain-containing protein [Undibacterium baiyunense]MBR7747028.1 transporter substrate-binding domain-containing protein [Undibacterium baiyunense]
MQQSKVRIFNSDLLLRTQTGAAKYWLSQTIGVLALTLIVCSYLIVIPSFAQTKVPLLFGENRNEKGELNPIPERFTRVFSAIEKDHNIQFSLQIYPWNRAVKIASTEGGLIFGLSLTPERAEIFRFSEPVVYQYLWLVTRTDQQFPFKTIEDLKGKTIGVVRGSKYGGEFDRLKNVLFKTDDDIDAYGPRLKKLQSRRIDAMIFASPLTNHKEVEALIKSIKIPQENETDLSAHQVTRFSVLPIPVLKDGIRFALLKGKNDKLISDIDRTLSRLNTKQKGRKRDQ